MQTRIIRAAGIFAAALVVGMTGAQAQSFPSKPIRVYSGLSAGTGADTVTRIVSAGLSERVKQPVVVENKLGAAGIVALQTLLQAPADGYTIALLTSSNAVQPALVRDYPFDLVRDFMPITNIYTGSLVVTVPAAFPAHTLGEFATYAKANPGKVFYGSTGVGSIGHLSGALLGYVGGFQLTHVPFKGTPEKNAALVAGDVQLSVDNYSVPKPLIDAGRLRVIAVTSKQRWPNFPDVPSLSEAFPNLEIGFWAGLVAPHGTPKEAFDVLEREIRTVIKIPSVGKQISAAGGDPGAVPSTEFAEIVAGDVKKWKTVTQAAGIKPE